MMKNPKNIVLNKNIKNIVLGYIREYDNYKKYVEEELKNIFSLSSVDFQKDVIQNFNISNLTEHAVIQLEVLKNSNQYKVVCAIDQAYDCLLCEEDIAVSVSNKIKKMIWKSCLMGKNFVFNYHNIELPISKSTFYRQRAIFINSIKNLLKL